MNTSIDLERPRRTSISPPLSFTARFSIVSKSFSADGRLVLTKDGQPPGRITGLHITRWCESLAGLLRTKVGGLFFLQQVEVACRKRSSAQKEKSSTLFFLAGSFSPALCALFFAVSPYSNTCNIRTRGYLSSVPRLLTIRAHDHVDSTIQRGLVRFIPIFIFIFISMEFRFHAGVHLPHSHWPQPGRDSGHACASRVG